MVVPTVVSASPMRHWADATLDPALFRPETLLYLWSAPTAERYWRKVIVAQIVIAREEEVARAFGINSPGG